MPGSRAELNRPIIEEALGYRPDAPIRWRGNYVSGEYLVDDGVAYQGFNFRAVRAVPAGEAPTVVSGQPVDGPYWRAYGAAGTGAAPKLTQQLIAQALLS